MVWGWGAEGGAVVLPKCAILQWLNTESIAFEMLIFDVLLIMYGYTVRLMKTLKWALKWASKWSLRASTTLCRW